MPLTTSVVETGCAAITDFNIRVWIASQPALDSLSLIFFLSSLPAQDSEGILFFRSLMRGILVRTKNGSSFPLKRKGRKAHDTRLGSLHAPLNTTVGNVSPSLSLPLSLLFVQVPIWETRGSTTIVGTAAEENISQKMKLQQQV